MKKILLLGSGELGKEFVIAAMRAGQYVIACDRYDNAPAMQVADEREVFSMLDGDALEAVVKKHQPDIIVPETQSATLLLRSSVCVQPNTSMQRPSKNLRQLPMR